VVATKSLVPTFHAVTNDSAFTVSTSWSDGLNGAFEAVEDMVLIVGTDGEALVVVVATYLTACHTNTSPSLECSPFDVATGIRGFRRPFGNSAWIFQLEDFTDYPDAGWLFKLMEVGYVMATVELR